MFASASFSSVAYASFGGLLYAAHRADAASGTSAQAARVTFDSRVAEGASGAEVLVSSNVFVLFVQEGASAQTTVSPIGVYFSSVSDAVQGTDSTAAQVNFAVRITEFGAGFEQFASRADYRPLVVEGVDVTDTLLGRQLWETINTQQPEGWRTVVVAQVTIATEIGGGFSAGAFSSGPISGVGGVSRNATLPDDWSGFTVGSLGNWKPIKNA